MPTIGPLQSQMYADEILSGVSIAYSNAQYISDVIFPEVQVPHKTGIYYKYDKQKFRSVNDIRAPGTRAQVVEYGLTKANYGPLLDHSLDGRIEWELEGEAVAPLDPAFDATDNVTERLNISKEVDAFNQCSNTAVITQNTTLSGTSRWDDFANSDPIGDMKTAIDAVKKATLKSAKKLTIVMGYEVYTVLRNHPQIMERIKYSQLGVLTEELLAQVFGVKQVILAEAESNSANPLAADSMAYVWGKNVWVLLVAEKPAPREISFGYTLRKGSRTVYRWQDQGSETDYVRVKDYYQQHIMAADAAYYYATVVN
jgi:hypothetical protein